MKRHGSVRAIVALVCVVVCCASQAPAQSHAKHVAIKEVNAVAAPAASGVIAIVGATLIDGRGGTPVPKAVVVVRGDTIVAAGSKSTVRIPAGASVVDATGKTLVPGLLDAHFHIDGDEPLPALYLSHGVTSVRDPGQWIEAYDTTRKGPAPVPRLFLCGPHLDGVNPAYPTDSYVVRDETEARQAVDRFADQGASAIKCYFRLPLGLIKVVTEEAHARGIPVMCHLEIVSATDAIRVGVDGIEHSTSFGTSFIPLRDAEKYRQAMLLDNEARQEGRYAMWSAIDFDTAQAKGVFDLVVERGTFVSPTLAIFERRAGDKETTDVHVKGFLKMEEFVRRMNLAGAKIVVGSHSHVPHAEEGWAYQRELELLVESGLTPMQALVAGTMQNARYFGVSDRLGSVEPGKQADLVLVDGDPIANISNMRRIERVMLNGVWVVGDAKR